MEAELKSLDSSDAPNGNVRLFRPDDAATFSVAVTASIGPATGEGAELFSFTICTARWLATRPLQKGFAFERLLLVERWDVELVERALTDLCRRTHGDDWHEIATKLSRYARWEFEDYAENP